MFYWFFSKIFVPYFEIWSMILSKKKHGTLYMHEIHMNNNGQCLTMIPKELHIIRQLDFKILLCFSNSLIFVSCCSGISCGTWIYIFIIYEYLFVEKEKSISSCSCWNDCSKLCSIFSNLPSSRNTYQVAQSITCCISRNALLTFGLNLELPWMLPWEWNTCIVYLSQLYTVISTAIMFCCKKMDMLLLLILEVCILNSTIF